MEAERDFKSTLRFPKALLAKRSDFETKKILDGEKRQFIVRKNMMQTQKQILTHKVSQHKDEEKQFLIYISLIREREVIGLGSNISRF